VRDECRMEEVAVDGLGTSFTFTSPLGVARLRTPLTGAYQAQNTATALTMLDAAGPPYRITPTEAVDALAKVRLPGRFQRVGRWVFDVAHNPDGARVLAETLRATQVPRPAVALVTVLADKDWRGILAALAPAVDGFVLTTSPTAPASRAWHPDEAHAHACAQGWAAELIPDFDAALTRAAALGATVVVTGSFHTVGDAMARLQVNPLAG